jgi:hypothetical protein
MIPLLGYAQEEKIDPVAVQILDHMSDVIGELKSCSYDLFSSQDVMDPDDGLVKVFQDAHVIMVGPDKILVNSDGDKGNRGFWYNGEEVIFYSYTENNYARIDAPGNIIATIDSLHMNYGLEIPAADFFYPAFTDDILDGFDTLKFLGRSTVNGESCFHLKSTSEEMEVQYWISNDAYFLPKRYLIIYKDKDNRQFQGTFSNWNLNPDIPESVFEFTPPGEATEIKILAKNEPPK